MEQGKRREGWGKREERAMGSEPELGARAREQAMCLKGRPVCRLDAWMVLNAKTDVSSLG